MLPSGLIQGMPANMAASPAYSDTAAVLAAMQQLQGGMAGVSVSAVPAVQASAAAAALALDSFPGAAAAASQLLVQPGVLQYAQRLGINSINTSQPMLCISNSQSTAGNHGLLVQQGGAPVAVNLGAGGMGTWGTSMVSAGQFPPGIVYQQVPGPGGLEPVPMQQQQLLQQPQLVLVPIQQLGGQAASTYGQELVSVPVSGTRRSGQPPAAQHHQHAACHRGLSTNSEQCHDGVLEDKVNACHPVLCMTWTV